MERNHCGHLGFPIDTILTCFDLDARFGSKWPKVWEEMSKLIFKIEAVAAILDFLSAH